MENEILNIVINKIDEIEGVKCNILKEGLQKKNKVIDAKIEIVFNKKSIRYYIEVKTKIVPAQISSIINQAKKPKPLLIIAEYITPKAKELLLQNNIAYADTAGNIFLKNKDLHIYIETNKTNRTAIKSTNRAFNKSGLKVVFQLLVNPDYLNKPYRFIGEKADVTIDTVSKVFQDLLIQKFIIKEDAKTFQFNNRKLLFEEWVKAFNNILRPKLYQKKFKWLNKKKNWKTLKLPKETFWAGANAAEILTDYLIADKTQIYTGIPFQEVMKSLKIIPDENGEIVLIEKFWKDGSETNNIVSPFLVYADLLFETNTRYLETAHIIYQQNVKDKL